MPADSEDRPQRALVTGCAGFIGSHLAEFLVAAGTSVVGIDCFNDNYGRAQKLHNLRYLTDWERFEFVPIDLSRGDLDDLVADADVVYHLAAEPGVRSSWGERYEQYLRNNVLATQHLLESLRRHEGRRLVYASSSSVYGDADVHPTPEDHRLRPRSPYGQTKAAMEHLCELYHANFGVDVVGLRYFTVYGPRQRPDMAFNRICRAALQGDVFRVFGDGRQTRDFSYVSDVVAATIAAADAPLNSTRIFNIGGGSPASLRQAIEIIGELASGDLPIEYTATEHGDVKDTEADTSHARAELNFSPQVGLRQGLAAELEWMQAAAD
jgi:nucleoside-diphosphate-sugar epimerase